MKYQGTHLLDKRFDVRYKLVAAYLDEKTMGKVIVELNAGEPRLSNYVLDYREYYANDINEPNDTCGVKYEIQTDTEVDINSDILMVFGYGAGEYTGQKLESSTVGDSIVRLAKYNPEYIVIEMCQQWENEFKAMTSLIQKLPNYLVGFEAKFNVEPVGHYHDKRHLVILKEKTK